MESALPEIENLKKLINESNLPPELKNRATTLVDRVLLSLKYGAQLSSIDEVTRYVHWITSLPWTTRTEDVLDLPKVIETLNRSHYGLTQIKERILEYIAVLKLLKTKNKGSFLRAPILCFVGLAGTGKTTVAQAIGESMNRKFARVPLGGMGSALELRGQSQALIGSEPGAIIKTLGRIKSKNPVILLDEIDRVSEKARSDVMGVLLELLDPQQNLSFTDNYIDYPFDLSEVLFIATANNTTNISTAVLDRLDIIEMPTYSDEEKILIAKNYMLAKSLDGVGIEKSSLVIDDEVWPLIIRPLGFDSGIRSLERTIQGLSRKLAKRIVEGQGTSFHITKDNIKEFIPSW